jgi:hypothetical protein
MDGVVGCWSGNREPHVAGNRDFGPDFDRILDGKLSKSALRQAEGWPEDRY